MSQTFSRLRHGIGTLVCSLAVAACEMPSNATVDAHQFAPRLNETGVGIVGFPFSIPLPPGATDVDVQEPDFGMGTDVATAWIDPPVVRIECQKPGKAKVILTADDNTKWTHLLECVALSGAMNAMVEEIINFMVPGGLPQSVYVTDPGTENVSSVAQASITGQIGGGYVTFEGIEATCLKVGEAWIKVQTGDGYWQIYSLTCTPLELEDRHNGIIDQPLIIEAFSAPPSSAYATVPYRRDPSSVAEVNVVSASFAADAFASSGSVNVVATCKADGAVWIRVQVSSENWMVFPLKCESHDQGGGS